MLQEVLLALAGYKSVLFDSLDEFHEDLSPAEREFLVGLKTLATLHTQVRQRAQEISDRHPSVICRATATSITSVQLARFRTKVVDVEAKILKRDSDVVGAYNVVPLAYIASEFKQYKKLLRWLFDLVSRIAPRGYQFGKDEKSISGAELINHLRDESVTGYPDIEKASKELGTAAETAWVKQLSSWILYGQLPKFGASDFAVQSNPISTGLALEMNASLLPRFVSSDTATAIFFVGKVRNLVGSSSHTNPRLLLEHVTALSRFSTSFSASDLSSGIEAIRISLSTNILNNILPLSQILSTLSTLHAFFLLGNTDFVPLLVSHADAALAASPLPPKPSTASDILQRTLTTLARSSDHDDPVLALAKQNLHLSITPPPASSPAFASFLLPLPTFLTYTPAPPLDLFLASSALYTRIHAFLLALRRARLHLSALWTSPALRRPEGAGSPPGMRAVWASAKAALDLLCHMSAYFEGDVVGVVWRQFLAQIEAHKDRFEVLQELHDGFLRVLVHGLLLEDAVFGRCVEGFLVRCEAFGRLLRDGGGEGMEREVGMLDAGMRKVVGRLRQIDTARVEGSGEVFKCGGVDRLLLKLNFEAVEEGEGSFDLV